jgi:hypothetical protein
MGARAPGAAGERGGRMLKKGGALCLAALMVVLVCPGLVEAQELALTVGKFLGDDVLESVPVVGPPEEVGFADGTLFGARFSMGLLFVEVEASLVTAGSAVLAETPNEFSARFTYAEAGVLMKLFPGPVAPFLAGGIGYHRIGWGLEGADSYGRLGYYIGAGLKFGLGKVGVRGDLRDHITPLKLDGLDPAVASAIGLDKDVTVHNFELSVALVISF